MNERIELSTVKEIEDIIERVPRDLGKWDFVKVVRFKTAVKNAVKEMERNKLNQVRLASALDDLKRFY